MNAALPDEANKPARGPGDKADPASAGMPPKEADFQFTERQSSRPNVQRWRNGLQTVRTALRQEMAAAFIRE